MKDKTIKLNLYTPLSNKQDESINKIKPILGQNQISLPLFSQELIKSCKKFNGNVAIRVILNKTSKDLVLTMYPPHLITIASQIFALSEIIPDEIIQDLIRIKASYKDDMYGKDSVYDAKREAKTIISFLHNIKKR